MKKYRILITPMIRETEASQTIERSYHIDLETDRLDWSMKQYQRNRPAFKWEVVDEN